MNLDLDVKESMKLLTKVPTDQTKIDYLCTRSYENLSYLLLHCIFASTCIYYIYSRIRSHKHMNKGNYIYLYSRGGSLSRQGAVPPRPAQPSKQCTRYPSSHGLQPTPKERTARGRDNQLGTILRKVTHMYVADT